MSQRQGEKLKAAIGGCLLAVLTLTISVQAVAATSTNKENAKEVAESAKKNLSLVFEATTSSNLYSPSSTANSTSLDLTFVGSYKLNKKLAVSTALTMSKDLQNSINTMYDLPITLKHSALSIYKDIKLTPSVSMVLPTTEASRDNKTLLASFAGKGTFSTSLMAKAQKVNLSLTTQVKKSFHKYTRDNLNNPNREYTFSNTLGASTAYKKFSFAISGTYSNGWDYSGNISPSFSIQEVISYDMSKKLSVSFGHTNAGRALGYNGVESNIDLFDGDSSMVFTTLTYVN